MPDIKTETSSSFATLETASYSVHSSEEVECQILDCDAADAGGGGPIDSPADDGPDLLHRGCGGRENFPPLDGSRHCGGTHDVNDELLTKEYRRGLRVTKLRCSLRDELGFVLDDV